MPGVKNSLLVIFLMVCAGSLAQENRYIVKFTDKENSPFSITAPSQFLAEKSIIRRAMQGIAVTEKDLPVNPEYVEGVKATGADVFFQSRWMNSVLIQTTEAIVTEVVSLPYVSEVELVAPGAKLNAGSRVSKFNENQEELNGATALQLNMLGVPTLHNSGFQGEDITIAFFDGGYLGVDTVSAFDHIYKADRMKLQYNFVDNTDDVYLYSSHGTRVFSTVSGKVPDQFTGVAPEASFMLFITEDISSEYRIEEYNWLFAAETADSAGVDIINGSLGYTDFDDPSMDYSHSDLDGKTAIVSQAANIAASKGILVVVSVGNQGDDPWQLATPPGDAENVIAVGSVNPDGTLSDFSSLGPTADQRTKPDVMALGLGTTVILPNGDISAGSGTSFAAPLIAGLGALLWQQDHTMTSLELFEMIRNLGNNADSPNNMFGYGVPNYNKVLSVDDAEPDAYDIFPNPLYSNYLNIKGLEGVHELFIYDPLGRVAYSQSINFDDRNSKQIDLSDLENGLYYLQLHSGKKTIQFKLIKH